MRIYFSNIYFRTGVFISTQLTIYDCQPGVWPDLLFSKDSQSSSGLKYSRIADASILSCPVITAITSGQGREDPRDRPALYKTFPHKSLFTYLLSLGSNIRTLISILPLYCGKCRSCEAVSTDLVDRIGRLPDTTHDETGTGWLCSRNI